MADVARRSWTSWAWLAIVPWIALLSAPGVFRTHDLTYTDPQVFRSAIELLRENRSPYDPERQRQYISVHFLDGWTPPYVIPFAYPPNAFALLAPYGVGSPETGYLLFNALTTLWFLVALWRLLRGSVASAPQQALCFALFAVSLPVLFNALLGQTGCLLGALAATFVGSYPRGSRAAGISLGLLAFKPQYAVFLALLPLIQRRFAVLAWAAAAFAATVLASGVAFGFGAWRGFVDALGRYNITAPWMSNWQSFANSPLSSRVTLTVMVAAAIGLAVLCFFLLRYGARTEAALAVLLLAAPFFSPNTHPYDLTLWGPALCLAAQAFRLPRPAWLFLAVIGLSWCFHGPPTRVVLALISPCLAAWVCWTAWRSARAPAHSG
ncbi:MAG TPA: glycosyltransferase family 87 protein [Myxococcaceae bacterium]|nr:glycosyltransferase family 87 protein [Myxococcaceae bacterium]